MIDVTAVTNALLDYSMRLGLFETTTLHEPKAAPGNGMTTALWCQEIATIPDLSGLDNTAIRLAFDQRIYIPMKQEPQDAIDPDIIDATQQVFNAYSTGFTLEGLAFSVDLLGAYGDGLIAKAGYINQDSTIYRAMVLNLPLIFADAFDQEA